MPVVSLIFLFAAVFFALFSKTIDKAAGGRGTVQKVILVFAGGVFVVSLIGLAASLLG